MKKKISFIQIIFSFFTIVLIVSSIFSFYILHNQEAARIYKNINKGLNENCRKN
jgi:TM2 domain-containing membrane protein YozV